MSGTLRSAIHVANDYKVLGGIQQYPWAETGGSTPLTPDQMAGFRRRMNFGAWSGSGGLYGTRAQVSEGRRLLSRALAGKVSRLLFLDDRRLAGVAILSSFRPDLPLGFEPGASAGASSVRLAEG
jgi:4-cresol dehydrogenase (hydroxylating) flavoprotein subunit